MSSLRALFRWMLLGWLVLVLVLSVTVARSTHSRAPGNLLAFLFTRGEPFSEPLPPVPPPAAPKPAPATKPAPPPPPPEPVAWPEPAPTPSSEDWVPLELGRKAGTGKLGEPEITILEDNTVEVLFSCPGKPGEYRLYHPANVAGLSVDLQGGWGKGMLVNQTLPEGVAQKVQIADHADNGSKWLRVSAVSRNAERLAARVEYSAEMEQLRVRFAPED